MRSLFYRFVSACLALGLLAGCAEREAEAPLFERLDPETTGVTFENTLDEGEDFNIFRYLYYYNGGGVAAGDVNGDGTIDEADLELLESMLGTCSGDIDRNGTIGVLDLLELIDRWGTCP